MDKWYRDRSMSNRGLTPADDDGETDRVGELWLNGTVRSRAMVFENESRWFAEDGQLTKRICEDTSLSVPDCCACDDAKYKVPTRTLLYILCVFTVYYLFESHIWTT